MRFRLGVAALVCAIGLAVVVVPSLTSASVPPPPPTFVAVDISARISLYSSSTGVRIRTLARLSDRWFTNNGLAYAPDGSAVYFTLIPRSRRVVSLRLMRLDTATGRQTFIAWGAQPALSDDRTQLAYGASPQGLAVRDLATGHTRTIGLAQLGKAANLMNASIGWLGDGSDVAVVPSPTAWDLIGRPPKFYWCGTTQSHPVIVFVHVPPPPAPLSAKCVHLAGGPLDGPIPLAGRPSTPTTLLLATTGLRDRTVVERITQAGEITRVLTIPSSLPLSFDPSGTHLLYLIGHSPPMLTEGTIANGRLTPGPWRRPADLGDAVW
jgi:hypothetical protein